MDDDAGNLLAGCLSFIIIFVLVFVVVTLVSKEVKKIEQVGLKSVLEDIWYGKGEKNEVNEK